MSITFERFATDPQLMGDIMGADSYGPMRSCIKAALAEPLSPAEAEAFRILGGEREPPLERVATFGVLAGRSAGKSEGVACLAAYLGTCVDWPCKPGQVPVGLLLAETKEQAGVLFNFVSGQLRSSPLLASEVESATQNRIVLRNGVELRVGVSDMVATRGPSYAFVICDEICYWPTSLTSASPDVETVTAVRPGLARMPGSMLVWISSPYAQQGVAYDDWRKYYGTNDPRTLIVAGGTRAFNSTFPQSEVDRAMADDPARFAAEYLGHWRTDVAAFVDGALVDGVTRSEPLELPRRALTATGGAIQYIAAVDPSGGRSDAAACAVAHLDGQRVVVDACRRWPSPHDPAQVAAEVKEFLAPYGLNSAMADQYAAGFSRAVYSAAGVTLSDATVDRSGSYLHLLPLLTQGRIELPPHPVLRVELLTLQRRTRSGGKDVVDHRQGQHDDLSNAVALAAYAASRAMHSSGGFRAIRSTMLDSYADGDGSTVWMHSDGRITGSEW